MMSEMSVREYIQNVSETEGVSLEEAAGALYDRCVEGEVTLVDPNPPLRFIDYLVSFYSLYFWLVVITLFITSLSIYVFPEYIPFSWVRVALGFIVTLYLPGYVFIEALYPKRDELEELERFALSVGLSIAITPLLGFLLNYTPWGIRLGPINVALSVTVIFFGFISVYRRYHYHKLRLEIL